jgi:single-stranded-DNA-specific exonuclease
MLYKWVYNNPAPAESLRKLKDQMGINDSLAQLLYDRSLVDQEVLERFINPELSHLHSPYLMKDMDRAVKRLMKALRDGENILVYGDYDVDGITGVSLLYEALFDLGGKVSFYIPDRISEGYGLSKEGIQLAMERGVDLILTVDCGITAIEETRFANEMGIDVVISDHHVPGESLPEAVAILNPKRKQCNYPFKELAGVGVGFKLIEALYAELGYERKELEKYLDLAALGTAADIVPLIDENRVLVKYGLDRINNKPRSGIFALMESSSLLGRELDVSLIVFVLAPRINAVGRISKAKKAVHLLTSSSLQQSRNIARVLESENKIRRDIDGTTCQDAMNLIDREFDLEKNKVLVLAKEGWHPGVIGIVASRIMEKYNRPALLISVKDGMGKGSARSTGNFDIYEALNSVSTLLENFGGHKFAAGLTIKKENISKLRSRLSEISETRITSEDLTPTLNVQDTLTLKDVDAQLLHWLKMLAPYGPSNMRPVYVSTDLEVMGGAGIVGGNHLKLKIRQDGIVIDAIAFNFGEVKYKMKSIGQRINAAYVIEENTWNGRTTIQMRIKDMELS